jgi:hypothetical protein
MSTGDSRCTRFCYSRFHISAIFSIMKSINILPAVTVEAAAQAHWTEVSVQFHWLTPRTTNQGLLWCITQKTHGHVILFPFYAFSIYSAIRRNATPAYNENHLYVDEGTGLSVGDWRTTLNQNEGGLCADPHPKYEPADDGGSKDLWNVGKLLPDYTVLQPRRQQSSVVMLITQRGAVNFITRPISFGCGRVLETSEAIRGPDTYRMISISFRLIVLLMLWHGEDS